MPRQQHLFADAVLPVLLHEADRVGAGEPRVDRVGLLGARLRQVRREVGRVERRIDLLDDLAAGRLEAGDEGLDRVAAGHEVRGHDDDPPVLRVLHHPRAHRIVRLIRRLGDAEDGGRRLLGRREHAREGDGDDQWSLLLVDVAADGDGDDATDRADQKIDVIALDELLDLGQRDVGLGLVVLLQHLDRAPARLAADLVQVELEAVGGVDPLHREHAGVGQQQADLDRRRLGGRIEGQDQREQEQGGQPSSHRRSPERGAIRTCMVGRGQPDGNAQRAQMALRQAANRLNSQSYWWTAEQNARLHSTNHPE